MSDRVEFTVPGEPVSKSRARFTKRGSKTWTYTPEKTLQAERQIALAYRAAGGPIGTDRDVAYGLEAEFRFHHRQRRDVDNMIKAVCDGLNGVAWPDDVQVVEVKAKKVRVEKDQIGTWVAIYNAGKIDRMMKACKRCGTEFPTWPSLESNHHFCSQECGYKYRVEQRRRSCKHCGGEFLAHGPGRDTKYCSKQCADSARWVDLICDECGDSFTRGAGYKRARNYCSSECRTKALVSRRAKIPKGSCTICGGPVSRKEYVRCNACRVATEKAGGRPRKSPRVQPNSRAGEIEHTR